MAIDSRPSWVNGELALCRDTVIRFIDTGLFFGDVQVGPDAVPGGEAGRGFCQLMGELRYERTHDRHQRGRGHAVVCQLI